MPGRFGMLRQKMVWTAAVSAAVIAATMALDYVLSILILRNPAGYTPLVTLTISAAVGIPVIFLIINASLNMREARDQLAAAHKAADRARAAAERAARDLEQSRQIAMAERAAALEASRAKSEFLANMSHELRTPLNAILGFSDMLKKGIGGDNAQEYAAIIHSSGRHLLSLINDILDLSKIEAGKYEPKPVELSVQDLVRDCISLMQPGAKAGGVVLRAEAPTAAAMLYADPRALRQILLNLVANSIKFTPPGGEVVIRMWNAESGAFCLEVADTGIGIAPEEQARVFESFGRGRHDVANAAQGTGLGLPIVRGLAEAHGGRVTLESAVGRGTIVRVFLPARQMEESAKRVA